MKFLKIFKLSLIHKYDVYINVMFNVHTCWIKKSQNKQRRIKLIPTDFVDMIYET